MAVSKSGRKSIKSSGPALDFCCNARIHHHFLSRHTQLSSCPRHISAWRKRIIPTRSFISFCNPGFVGNRWIEHRPYLWCFFRQIHLKQNVLSNMSVVFFAKNTWIFSPKPNSCGPLAHGEVSFLNRGNEHHRRGTMSKKHLPQANNFGVPWYLSGI